MCQEDFDFGLVAVERRRKRSSVGKMERKREFCNGPSLVRKNSILEKKSDDNGDEENHSYFSAAASASNGESSSNGNNNMIKRRRSSSSLEEKNSFEDGSQGSEISGLDHQLLSMGKGEISGGSNGDRRTDTDSACVGCLSCSRQRRRDDYSGNDFGECHQHQVSLLHSKKQQQQQKKKNCWNRVTEADSSTTASTTASEIDLEESAVVSDTLENVTSSFTDLSSKIPSTKKKSQQPHSYFREIGSISKPDFFNGSASSTYSRAMWIQLGVILFLSFNLQGISAVRINALSVPRVIKNGTEESVILDCDYSIEDEERKGLVVKWYFSNKQTPVYQWIPNSKPISLGILKGKLNLDYEADLDNYKKKRALQIIRPTTELSGNWICHVSTFDGDAMEAAKMIIFAPEKDMEMKVVENRRGNFVNISCWATRLFPKPRMMFFHEEQEVPDVKIRVDEHEGAYDIRAYKVIEDTSLSSLIGSVFDCELVIPSTNYVKKRSIVFEPGSLELKDAMRMSIGIPRVSPSSVAGLVIPLVTIFHLIGLYEILL